VAGRKPAAGKDLGGDAAVSPQFERDKIATLEHVHASAAVYDRSFTWVPRGVA